METFRIINPKKKNRVFFKTEAWIRQYAHTMKLHNLFFSDPKEISTEFNLFLKQKGILLQSNTEPVKKPETRFQKRLDEAEKKREEAKRERVPVDDEQPEPEPEPPIDYDTMTIKQLREHAKENNIGLGQLRKKSDIINAIVNH